MSDATKVDAAAEGTGATRREGQGNRFTDQEERFTRGTLIGRYVITDVLGAGGMGVVYSAFDPELDRKVAIKVLQARAGGSESGGQTWLLREAQAMARLAHPNVVAVYDVGAMSGDLVFVAMELVEGVTLRTWLKAKPRTWREVVPVMRAAGAWLAAAHAAGLVHRDFKPDNVLVGNDGRVRVMDFGLARLEGEEPAQRTSDLSIEKRSPLSERLTATGAVLGTPAYMAPEIYAGHVADPSADQFAFGVALYEALYRVRPFDRKALVAQRAVAPKPPAIPKVPSWVEKIALKAVALDPKQRYASMAPLLAALANDPTTRRKRIAIASITALAVAGGIVGAVGFREAPLEQCTDAATRLTGVWDGTTRSALEKAFAKVPNSTDTMHGTEKTLDAYAKGWVAMRTESCKATRVHGSQSEEVLTLRMACLDERLAEVEALVGLFGNADAKLVQGSVGAAQKLSKILDCADVPALLAQDPLPKDPLARIQVGSLKKQLAAARAIYKSQQLGDTLALLQKITPEATRLNHLPTIAELHLLTGQTLWVMQGNAIGEPELLQAAWSAEAGKADLIKLEAWLQLANLANEASHFDLARERLHNASAALARLGTNWNFKVRILDAEALLESRLNNYDKSIEIAGQARDVAAKHTEADSQSYALLVEASILTSAGHAQDAVADFKKVLAFQDALGHHRIDVAVTLQSLAGAEMVTGHIDDAIPHLQDALEVAKGIYGENNSETAQIYNAIGVAQVGKGDLVAALATHQKALAIAEATVGKDDEIYALMSGQVGYTLVSMQKPKEAMPYLDRALQIETKKLGPSNVQVLSLMLTKCDILHANGAMKAAVDLCEHTLALGEKSLGVNSPLLFLFLEHTGDTLVDAKQPKRASVLLERAQKLGSMNPSDNFAVLLLDASAVWDLGNHKRAIALAQQARAGFTQLAQADQVKEVDDWLKKHH